MQLTLNKMAAGLVGIAMVAGLVFAFAAERAHAVTLSELVELFIALEVIPEDKADEARAVLQGQEEETSAPTTGGSVMSCNFTRNLTTGDTGADVMDLQKFLNGEGFSVALSGVGSAGMETDYFGGLTSSAVAAFQNAYASEILTPLGLSAGTGYFGASTRAKANALCAAAPEVPEVPVLPGDDDDDMMGDDDDDDELSGSEASLEDFDALSSPSEEELVEGEEEAEVYGFEFDVEDGDVEIRRVDVRFEMTGTSDEEDPWNVFDTVSLWQDGEMIAEENADDEDDWQNEAGDVWEMRFSGLDVIAEEGETPGFVVAVSVMSLDDGDIDGVDEMTWTVWIPENGVRARDGAGLDQYVGDADTSPSDEETFTIETAGNNTEMKTSTASGNPESSIIKVEEYDRSDEVTVAVFDVEADDGEITLNKIVLSATTSDDLASVVNDVVIELDGTRFNDCSWETGAASGAGGDTLGVNDSFAWIICDLEEEDEEMTLEENEEIDVKVLVEFKQQNGNYAQGTTLEVNYGTTERNEWSVEDVTGDELDDTTEKSGTLNGEAHQLQSEGIYAEIVSTDTDVTAGDNNSNDVGEFTIKFDVTSFENTYYLSATSTSFYVYHIEDGNGESVSTTSSPAISSTATRDGDSYRVDEGDTETFTLDVTLNPDTTGYYRVELDTIDFGTTELKTDDEEAHVASPDEDFETDNQYINA